MRHLNDQPSLDACPASAVIAATREAKTPLAIADAQAAGATIMFANDAFAALARRPAAALVGCPLASLAGATIVRLLPGSTDRFDLVVPDGPAIPVSLSTAAVTGADGSPLCLLCSLVEVGRDGGGTGPARDVELLDQVARAASDLMRERGALMEPQTHP